MANWKEKWNYKPVFIGEINEETKNRFKVAQIQELFSVKSQVKTYCFNQIIQLIVSIANDILTSLNLPSIAISEEQVLLLTKKEFKDNVLMNEDDAGKCCTGYIYIIKQRDNVRLIHDLSHEISHLISFYRLKIKKRTKDKIAIDSESGYTVNIGTNSFLFDGLSEATTELFAYEIRKRFVEQTNFLTVKDAERLCNTLVYYEHISLIRVLLSIYAKGGLSKDLLFKSYIDGSNDFINTLKACSLKAYEQLMILDSHNYNILNTAFKIGGEKLEKEVNKELSYGFKE